MTQPNGELDTATGGDSPPLPTALAQHDVDWEDGPWTVNGVALPENERAVGVAGDPVYYPPDVLEAAAESLVGRNIVDDRDHANLERVNPAVENIIGEVTATSYEPGVGVLYEGEVDDPETAKQVERGRVDPSPMLWRRLGEYDDEKDAYPAEEIVRWRDLSVVSNGASESASIQPGAATALQAEALRATFQNAGPDALRQFTHLRYDGTTTGKLDKSNIPSDSYRSHYLYPSSTKSASSFPVVGGDGKLKRGNVESAWRERGHAPGSREDAERILVHLAEKFDDPPFSEADADALAQTIDEPGGTEPGRGADNEPDTMELTDDEEALIHTARSTESPVVVTEEQKSLARNAGELNIDQYDDPTVLESDDHDALQERVSTVKSVFADALARRTDMNPETADALSLDVLMAEFEDEDGELEADALAQNPETGGAGDPTDPGTATPDALSDEQQSEVESLAARAETFDGVDDALADALREEATELAGAEEWSDIEGEVV